MKSIINFFKKLFAKKEVPITPGVLKIKKKRVRSLNALLRYMREEAGIAIDSRGKRYRRCTDGSLRLLK